MDFAEFRTPWGKRHALMVVLGYSRRMWLRFYESQTMMVVIRGIEESFQNIDLAIAVREQVRTEFAEADGQRAHPIDAIRYEADWNGRLRELDEACEARPAARHAGKSPTCRSNASVR